MICSLVCSGKVLTTSPVIELTPRHGHGCDRQVLARFAAKLHAPALANTASCLPINVEGHVCKMLTVQAVPAAQCLRSGPTESARQPFSALR
jgi:hypothetical protein